MDQNLVCMCVCVWQQTVFPYNKKTICHGVSKDKCKTFLSHLQQHTYTQATITLITWDMVKVFRLHNTKNDLVCVFVCVDVYMHHSTHTKLPKANIRHNLSKKHSFRNTCNSYKATNGKVRRHHSKYNIKLLSWCYRLFSLSEKRVYILCVYVNNI